MDDAYAWTRASLQSDPSFMSAYNTLGIIYARRDNLDLAEAAFRSVVEREPEHTRAMANLAEVYTRQGRVAEATALRLKLAQREQAIRMGIELIEWTYDPLQTLNAHLNFTRLGVVVEEYAENIYGESTSPLHQGTPTDRFIAQWRLTAPHVERRLTAPASPLMRDASVMSAVSTPAVM